MIPKHHFVDLNLSISNDYGIVSTKDRIMDKQDNFDLDIVN